MTAHRASSLMKQTHYYQSWQRDWSRPVRHSSTKTHWPFSAGSSLPAPYQCLWSYPEQIGVTTPPPNREWERERADHFHPQYVGYSPLLIQYKSDWTQCENLPKITIKSFTC